MDDWDYWLTLTLSLPLFLLSIYLFYVDRLQIFSLRVADSSSNEVSISIYKCSKVEDAKGL